MARRRGAAARPRGGAANHDAPAGSQERLHRPCHSPSYRDAALVSPVAWRLPHPAAADADRSALRRGPAGRTGRGLVGRCSAVRPRSARRRKAPIRARTRGGGQRGAQLWQGESSAYCAPAGTVPATGTATRSGRACRRRPRRSLLDIDDVRTVVAEAVQRGFCDVDSIAEELRAGRRNGSSLLRRAVREVADGAASAPEARAGRCCERRESPPFEQNAPVVVGSRCYFADFLWRELWAILEIDSREYHFAPQDWQATLRRDAALETAGYSVIHVVPSDLRDGAEFVRRVRQWLASRHLR